MGIDISRLSPSAQAQIARKIVEQEKRKRIAASPQAAPRNDGIVHPEDLKSDPSVSFADSSLSQREPKTKYHSTPTERITADGNIIKFDSQKEARRFDELILMLKTGQIKELKLQPQFTLQEAYTTPEGKRVRAIRYQADFSYDRRDPKEEESAAYWGFECTSWEHVVEDVKSKATKTRVYSMKKKLMHDRFGITVQEIE